MISMDSLATTLNRIAEEGGRLLPAPTWGKLSFRAWKKAGEELADNPGKPQKKAQRLIEQLINEDEQKDHPDLRDMFAVKGEDLNFDKQERNVIAKILK